MKKSRFLALALVVAIALMGAGYAAWEETVTINNTVDTGELDIELSNGTATYNGEDGYTILHPNESLVAVVNSDATTDNVVNINLENLYPGLTIDVSIPIENVGTIPVQIDPAKTNELVVTGLPTWLSITAKDAPDALAVDGTGNVTFTILVGEDAPENTTNVQFKLDTNYLQFNK